MDVFQMGADPIRFMSSVDSESTTADDLLTVDYTRAQKASPEFLTVYEGIDQNIDVKISTFVFKAAPEAVLMLYDFIMTTFVPDTGNNAEQQDSTVKTGQGVEQPVQAQAEDQKIRVLVKLASIQGNLFCDTDYAGLTNNTQLPSAMAASALRRCPSPLPMSLFWFGRRRCMSVDV